MPATGKRTQITRTMAIGTALGDDALILVGMHGAEALGRLYQFELDLASEGQPVDYKKILGTNVTVRYTYGAGGKTTTRYFNGLVSRFGLESVDETDPQNKIYSYSASMVPALWMLTRTADCRIFQNKSAKDIIEGIIRDNTGIEIDDDGLLATYRVREYCVQYRETHFNFISRLMEEEGIYYYFTHTEGKHKIVLCDARSTHKAADGYDKLSFDDDDLGSDNDAFIWDWTIGQEVMSTDYTLTDYNFETPSASLLRTTNVDYGFPPKNLEIFDFPGGYFKSPDGANYIKDRMDEVECQHAVAHGTSGAQGIYAGTVFELTDHPVSNAKDYLITAATYQLRNENYGSTGGAGSMFECHLTCLPTPHPFRPARVTPKPVVQGPQTAVVVGPKGEEIFVDKYSRVKVQFFWDRDGKKDENSSCYIRVSQGVAGKGWGIISIPRIGQEVIVDFIEGDPDRPIVTGRVYNADNMPPYALPGNKTMSTFKSNTSIGGGGFNEFRFEDKKDSEQVFINAQKNMDTRVGNDRFHTVGHDEHLVVDHDMMVHIKNNRNTTIDNNYIEKVAKDKNEAIGGKEAKTVGGSRSLKVGGDVIEVFSGNHSQVTSNQLFLKAADIIIQGTHSITIKVGGSSIAIGSDGIKITVDGDLTVTSTGQTSMTATTQTTVTSKKTTINGDTEVDVTGANISVNADAALNLKAGANVAVKGAIIQLN